MGNFRQTIFTQNSGDWKTISVLKNEQHKLPLGIGGEAFIPQNRSWVSFSTVNIKHLDNFYQAELFLFNPNKAASTGVRKASFVVIVFFPKLFDSLIVNVTTQMR